MVGFDGGFGPSNFRHLKRIYQLEEESEESKLKYQKDLKNKNPEAYEEFLEFKEAMENNIRNFKQALLYGEEPIINID